MKTLKLLVLLGALQVNAGAALLIEGTLGGLPVGTFVNLNDYDAFAYYGVIGVAAFATIGGNPTTDAANAGQFSKLTVSGGGSISNSDPGSTFFPYTIAYTGAVSPGITPTGTFDQNNVAGTKICAFIQTCRDGSALTFSTVLFAPEQTFQIYLRNYNTRSDLFATLSGAGGTFNWSLEDQVLPTFVSNGSTVGDGTGLNHTFGILTLTVTGEIGDILTFTNMAEFDGVSNSASGNIGIAAIAVMAIPEPSVWACLVVGLGALVGLRRLRE